MGKSFVVRRRRNIFEVRELLKRFDQSGLSAGPRKVFSVS